MAEHGDARVEAALRDLGRRLELPSLRHVAATVRARLTAAPTTAGRARWLPRLAAAIAAAPLALVVAAAASAEVRTAIGNVLRFAVVDVRQEPGPRPSGRGLLPRERP